MKNYIKNVMVGIGLGSTTHLIIMIISDGVRESRADLVRILIMSALIGLLSNVYLNKKLSMLSKTVVQLFGSLGLVLATGYLNNWYDVASLKSILIFCLIFLVIFMIIWGIIYFINKVEAEKINRKLATRNK